MEENKRDKERAAGQGRGSNLTSEDRARGGKHSAEEQSRDDRGQFAGKKEIREEDKIESTPIYSSEE